MHIYTYIYIYMFILIILLLLLIIMIIIGYAIVSGLVSGERGRRDELGEGPAAKNRSLSLLLSYVSV